MSTHYVCKKCRRGTSVTKGVAPKCPTCGSVMEKEIRSSVQVPWTKKLDGFVTK